MTKKELTIRQIKARVNKGKTLADIFAGELPTVKEIGLEILWVGEWTNTNRMDARFRPNKDRDVGVRHLCCDKEAVLKLATIHARITTRTKQCASCSRKGKQGKKSSKRATSWQKRVEAEAPVHLWAHQTWKSPVCNTAMSYGKEAYL